MGKLLKISFDGLNATQRGLDIALLMMVMADNFYAMKGL